MSTQNQVSKHAFFGSYTVRKLTAEEVTLQVLGVQIRLGAVRAGELSVGVLDGNHRVLGAGSCSLGRRAAGRAGQDAPAALGAHDVRGLVAVLEDRVGLHERAGAVGRGDAGLGHDASRRHGTQHRRATATSGRGSNGLRVRGGRGGLRHHARRRGIALVRRVRILGHGVDARTRARLRRLLLVAGQAVGRGSVWRARRARRVRVAPVERLHRNGMGLQRRERLRQRRARLKLVRRDGSRRRVRLSRRCCVYTIGRVLRAVHNPARKTRRQEERKDVCGCFCLVCVCCLKGERNSRWSRRRAAEGTVWRSRNWRGLDRNESVRRVSTKRELQNNHNLSQ